MYAENAAIVGFGASGRSQGQPRTVGYNGYSGCSDTILVEGAPGDRPLVAQPELGKEVGIVGDLNRRAMTGREPLPVGGREVSVAHRGQ